jgi:hypothetical protein
MKKSKNERDIEQSRAELHASIAAMDKLIRKWKRQVYDRAKLIDPSNEQDWYSLCLGWAIAQGLTPEQADIFAIYIRYHTDFG